MTLRARIGAAAVAIFLIASGAWLYQLWPRWYGAEVLLPVTLGTPRSGADVIATFPDSHLRLDAETLEVSDTVRVDVRSIGVVWDSRNDPTAEASRIRNRTVYLQMTTTDKKSGTGEALWHPVSISTTLVPDVVNLRVEVRESNRAGFIDVDIAGGRVPLQKSLVASPAAAILKVLPSGRHAIVGVIVNNTRVIW